MEQKQVDITVISDLELGKLLADIIFEMGRLKDNHAAVSAEFNKRLTAVEPTTTEGK